MRNSFTKIFSVIIIPVLLCSCTRYYSVYAQVQQSPKLKSVTLDSLNKQKKYFLIHAGDAVYGIENVSVDTSGLTISGRLTGIPGGHSLYVKPHKHSIWGAMRIYYKSESGILDEAHLYTEIPLKDSALNIPVATIQKIETIRYNQQKTNTVNTIAIVVLLPLTILSIVALSNLGHF